MENIFTVQKLLNSWRKKIAHKSDAYGQKAQCLSFPKWYIMKSSVQPFLRKSKNKNFLLNKKIFLLSKQKNFFRGKFFVMIHLHNKIFFADLKTHKQKS